MTGSNISNLLGLARSAQLAGNQEEALSYFNRVLEADPTISEAWMGKGKAAAWQSSLANMRVNEGIVAFGHAIATAAEADKALVTAQAVEEINRLVATLYGMARRQLNEFVALPNMWTQYIGQISQLLNALEEVRSWSPYDRTTLENIVHLCKDNIEGVSYNDPYEYNVSKAWHLSPEYEVVVKSRLDAAVNALRQSDPDYSAPTIEKRESGRLLCRHRHDGRFRSSHGHDDEAIPGRVAYPKIVGKMVHWALLPAGPPPGPPNSPEQAAKAVGVSTGRPAGGHRGQTDADGGGPVGVSTNGSPTRRR